MTCTPRCWSPLIATRRSFSNVAAVIARVTSSGVSRLTVDDRFQLLIAKDNDQEQVRLDQSPQRPTQEIRRQRVGQLGEKNDHRTARQLRRQRRQRERIVGFIAAVVDLRRDPLELGECTASRTSPLDSRGRESNA